MLSSRSCGVAWLLDGLWHQLGVDAALASHLDDRGFTPEVERALFSMVAHRAIDPNSTLAEWIAADIAITDLDELGDELFDRAMTMVADVQVQESVFRAVVERLRLDDDVGDDSAPRPSPSGTTPDAERDDARRPTPPDRTTPDRTQGCGDGDTGVQHDARTTQDEAPSPLDERSTKQRHQKKKKKKKTPQQKSMTKTKSKSKSTTAKSKAKSKAKSTTAKSKSKSKSKAKATSTSTRSKKSKGSRKKMRTTTERKGQRHSGRANRATRGKANQRDGKPARTKQRGSARPDIARAT
jgi:hypothetical protein